MAPLQVLERLGQLAILLLQLGSHVLRLLAGERRPELLHRPAVQRPRGGGQVLADPDGRALAAGRLHVQAIDQPTGTDEAQAGGAVPAPAEQRLLHLRDAGPFVAHARGERLGHLLVDRELQHPAPRVLDGVARHLRHRDGDPRLVLGREAETPGHVARPLARRHHVAVGVERLPEQGQAHGASNRSTTTVTSSRRREWSR